MMKSSMYLSFFLYFEENNLVIWRDIFSFFFFFVKSVLRDYSVNLNDGMEFVEKEDSIGFY